MLCVDFPIGQFTQRNDSNILALCPFNSGPARWLDIPCCKRYALKLAVIRTQRSRVAAMQDNQPWHIIPNPFTVSAIRPHDAAPHQLAPKWAINAHQVQLRLDSTPNIQSQSNQPRTNSIRIKNPIKSSFVMLVPSSQSPLHNQATTVKLPGRF